MSEYFYNVFGEYENFTNINTNNADTSNADTSNADNILDNMKRINISISVILKQHENIKEEINFIINEFINKFKDNNNLGKIMLDYEPTINILILNKLNSNKIFELLNFFKENKYKFYDIIENYIINKYMYKIEKLF